MGFLPKTPGFVYIYMYTKGLFGETDHVSKYINIIILSQTLPWTACLASGRQQEHPRSRMYYVNSWFYILYFHFAYDLASLHIGSRWFLRTWMPEPNGWWKLINTTIFIGLGQKKFEFGFLIHGWFQTWKKISQNLDLENESNYEQTGGFCFFSGLYDVFSWFSRFWLKIKGFLEKNVFSRTYPVFNPYKTRIFWFS